MSHFAEISGSISGSIIIPAGERSITYTVVNVIVAEQDFIDSGAVGIVSNWVQTSYNTHGGVHYGMVSGSYVPDGGTQVRKNFAGFGYTYDESKDAFIAPQPEPSASIPYVLNEDTCRWELSE